jgi:SAM-dependent methyltransferase
MTRDKILTRWVNQPSAEPNVQYLRDAERLTAWDQLGERTNVLDIASESNVTAGLDAETITRVDFSSDAIEYAQELLGDHVARYESIDPETPSLPFADDQFDGAVCIGPYDWKFLDVQALTDEVHRVMSNDGLFTLSVPTPRSPYATTNWNKYRYYSPDEALSLISPEWRLADYDLVFQYPSRLHYGIKFLPERIQELFVDGAWELTDRLTEHEQWSRASYLVLGMQPLDYEGYLDAALDCLFRPTERNGFWDEDDEKFVRALEYEPTDDGLRWTQDNRVLWRYAPFALMGAMEWRTSSLGHSEYDGKLGRELAYFTDQIREQNALNQMPSYGVGPVIHSFSLAASVFKNDEYESLAWDLYEYSTETFDFSHAEDSLLAYGWASLYEHTGSDAVRESLEDALWNLIERLSPDGLFRFENETTRRHQNQMYALWGLCRAIEVTDKPGYLDSIEQVLDYTIEHRMRPDGAFIWEDVPSWRKLRAAPREHLGLRPPHWEFLYACHQTFFVNAVAQYYRAGGAKNYDRAVRRAMAWIDGDNPLDENLVERSDIGVPMRQMTTDGRIDVSDQMYKGAYEVGSYIMSLTNLLDGPFERMSHPDRSRDSVPNRPY